MNIFKGSFYSLCCREDNSGGDGFALIGDRAGQAAEVTWTAHGRGWSESGGPFSWRRNLDMCFDGQIGHSGMDKLWKNPNSPFSSASEERQHNYGQFNIKYWFYQVWDQCWDPSVQQVGSQWTCPADCYTGPDFVDEIMLNTDMGLMWNFQVSIIYTCTRNIYRTN